MKKTSYIMVFVIAGSLLRSQDIHFSQFSENPALINPALTGAASSIRVSLVNRDQWRNVTKPYKTAGASAEARLRSDGWQEHRGSAMVAAGLSFYHDRVGDGNLGHTQANLSWATFVAVDNRNVISAGLQASMVQRMVDNNRLLFPNQYNGSIYEASQPSNENFANTRFTYFDMGAGAQWTYAREQKNMDAYKQFTSHFGFAVYHLSQPRQEYFAALSKIYMKYVSHGDLIASIRNTHMAISPAYLVQIIGPSKEVVAGATLRHYLKSESKYTGLVLRDCFGYGLSYRSSDALVFSALFERQQKLGIILSYDVNISSLKRASSFRGGFEITLRYTSPKSFFYHRKKETAGE